MIKPSGRFKPTFEIFNLDRFLSRVNAQKKAEDGSPKTFTFIFFNFFFPLISIILFFFLQS